MSPRWLVDEEVYELAVNRLEENEASILRAFDSLECGFLSDDARVFICGSPLFMELSPEDRARVYGLALAFGIVAVEYDRHRERERRRKRRLRVRGHR